MADLTMIAMWQQNYWSIKPELTSRVARQSVVFPPSGDSSYLSIQLGRSDWHRR
jgi:hypothetical protein